MVPIFLFSDVMQRRVIDQKFAVLSVLFSRTRLCFACNEVPCSASAMPACVRHEKVKSHVRMNVVKELPCERISF